MSYEHKHQPLAPLKVYRRRQLSSAAAGGAVLGVSLAVGVTGYHWFGGLAWLDALVNASMILGGMGPVDPITRPDGKVFASVYALYSGVALLTSVGIILAPGVHRILHKFHVEMEGKDPGQKRD